MGFWLKRANLRSVRDDFRLMRSDFMSVGADLRIVRDDFRPMRADFWAATPKGTKSCRTQGDFHLFLFEVREGRFEA